MGCRCLSGWVGDRLVCPGLVARLPWCLLIVVCKCASWILQNAALAEWVFASFCKCGRGLEAVMDNAAFDTADVPLLFAVKYLIREYRNCIATLQLMLDENRDLFVPLPNDHPVALGIPLPHSLLAPHRHFCDAVRAAIATIESLVESMEAWADDIERTVRDAVRQTRRMLQNRSHPY